MDLNNLCKTCKHWRPEFNVNEAGDVVRGDWGFCCFAESGLGDSAKQQNSLAIAVNGEPNFYGAMLQTKENFGCVQWEN